MKKEVTLNLKEQKRSLVLNELLAGRLTGQEAAEVLGLSLRHTRRLIAAYRQEGAAVLAHGNRGKRSHRRTPETVEEKIVALARGQYHDYNNCHFSEELEEQHGLLVSSSTVRRIRQRHGLPGPRKRRVPRHRRRRERYPQPGMLLQVDGSQHNWLEERGPWLTLHAAIDDATNEVPWAVFRETEDATGYALLIHHISQTHGLPLALYADRHTIFQNPKEATIEEQLAGLEPRSHLGHLLHSLDIHLIGARSPQAKGRVERLFGTLQDRLVKELRQVGATNLEEANAALRKYLPRFNKRFTKPPAQSGTAYRPQLSRAEANARICFTYWRTVTNDHTISLFGHDLNLPDLPVRLNLAGRRIQLRHRMDGRLTVVYKRQVLGSIQPAQLGPPRLEQFVPAAKHLANRLPPVQIPSPPPSNGSKLTSSKEPRKPDYNHPWRRQGRATYRYRQQQKEQNEIHE
jgi:transposase